MTRISQTSPRSTIDTSSPDYIKKYSKQMLRNSLFIGTFQEKRFVEPLNSYRDVVTVCQDEEDFIHNLVVVKKKIDEGFMKRPWLGITEPDTVGAPVGYNLWVELSEEVFGKYWYKVKTVEFLENEIRLKLDIIRPVKEHSPLRTSFDSADQSISSGNVKEYFEAICQVLKLNFLNFYATTVTLENIKQSVIFLSLLIGTILTGGIGIIQYLLEYILKLIREISLIINAVTPIIISLINLIGKSVFGFYSMIVALYRSKPKQPPVYNTYLRYDPQTDPRQLQYYSNYQRPLEYYNTRQSRSGVVITPLD